MKASMMDTLKDMVKENIVSFHIPGHKKGNAYKNYEDHIFKPSWLELDVTEIKGTDNLHAPKEMIKQAQENAAKFFGADETFFLVNGTSCGNIAALMSIAGPNDAMIVQRDCHKSIMHGMVLGGIEPIYVYPKTDSKWKIPMGVTPDSIEKALINNPQAKGVCITYPNYYGVCSDIEKIAKITHKYGKVLIVDEAHGAHFILSEDLPMTALEAGADIVIQSIHKTLPSLTQSSMLHVKSNRVDLNRLKNMLMIMQSSSPSYLLMTSLDEARRIAQSKGHMLMRKLLKYIHEFKNDLEDKSIECLDKEYVKKIGMKDFDDTRLVMSIINRGINGKELDSKLRDEYHIQMELSDIHSVVGVCSIGNEEEDFNKLKDALMNIDKKSFSKHRKESKDWFQNIHPEVIMSPRKAMYAPKRKICLKNSIGKISGEYIIPYPPGVPMVCPGEKITKDIVELIDYFKNEGIEMIGMEDTQLQKIEVIDERS